MADGENVCLITNEPNIKDLAQNNKLENSSQNRQKTSVYGPAEFPILFYDVEYKSLVNDFLIGDFIKNFRDSKAQFDEFQRRLVVRLQNFKEVLPSVSESHYNDITKFFLLTPINLQKSITLFRSTVEKLRNVCLDVLNKKAVKKQPIIPLQLHLPTDCSLTIFEPIEELAEPLTWSKLAEKEDKYCTARLFTV